MANFRNRKRLEALEERIWGTPAERMRQQEVAAQLIVRWFVVDGCRDGPKVPADGEAAWLAFLRWQQDPPYGDEPRPGVDRDTFLRTFAQMQADDRIHAWELDPA